MRHQKKKKHKKKWIAEKINLDLSFMNKAK